MGGNVTFFIKCMISGDWYIPCFGMYFPSAATCEHSSKASYISMINMFCAIYIAEHSKSCLSLPRDCSTQRCQRNRNEIYRTCTFHVWHCQHIWFHCWSWLHWMVSLILFLFLISLYLSGIVIYSSSFHILSLLVCRNCMK